MSLQHYLSSREQLENYCRQASRVCPVKDSLVLARILGSSLLLIDMRDLNLSPHLAMDGFWESWITLAVARSVQRGWNCVDVGANYGYYTMLLASLVGDVGKVWACEPNPQLTPLLRQSADLNGFAQGVDVLEVALLDTVREVELHLPTGYFSNSMNASICGRFPREERFTVSGRTLDDLFARQRIDFIKIDAEGAELLIWQGMQRLIADNPQVTILMEFNAGRYSDPVAFVQSIESCNFPLRFVNYDGSIAHATARELCDLDRKADWMLWLSREARSDLP